MGNTTPAFLDRTAAGRDGTDSEPSLTPETLRRRLAQRREIQGVIFGSHAVDVVILLIYAYAGAVPVAIAAQFAACSFIIIICQVLLSETGIIERFKDHFSVQPLLTVHVSVALAFAYMAPQVSILFLCDLFVVFGFGSLRAVPRQMAVVWTVTAIGLACLFLLTDKPIAIPYGSGIERFGTMMVFVLGLGRCMFLVLASSATHQALRERGIKLKEAYKRIEELAEIDELTGALNRRHIMRTLGDELTRAHRAQIPCSIALIDLDWFKRINDTFGHPTGDEVLRTFAITVFANIRQVDRFGRYGGEEFLLVLPDTPCDDAQRILDRLRAIIAELDWSAFAAGMSVTISAGVATLKSGEWSDTFLARADKALYEAKAQGRNRIVIA
jgi:diguanylate cyclase (GGDEF)-like protein